MPRNSGTVTTMIGALDLKGVPAMVITEGAADAEVLETFVERVLARKLRPGDIVVLDDVGPRKLPNACRLIGAVGASLLFLPLYSLELNPIELCWSKLKSILTDLGVRTQQALDGATRRAMDVIGSDDAVASFTHCGSGAQVKCSALCKPGRGRAPPGNRVGQKYFAERALRAWACLM